MLPVIPMFNWLQASNNCLCVKPCVELQYYKLQQFKILDYITIALTISFTQILCKKKIVMKENRLNQKRRKARVLIPLITHCFLSALWKNICYKANCHLHLSPKQGRSWVSILLLNALHNIVITGLSRPYLSAYWPKHLKLQVWVGGGRNICDNGGPYSFPAWVLVRPNISFGRGHGWLDVHHH